MSVAKIIEICSQAPESFGSAIQSGIEEACKTLDNVHGAWVDGQKVIIEDGKIVAYRVHLKVTFVLE